MTTIKVTPEQLISVSKQFAAAQNQVFQMNSILKQHLFEIERQWDGSTKERFYVDFMVAQRVMDDFVSLSLSIAKELQGHAEKFRLADQQVLQSYDPSCAAPPPDECRAPAADTRNAFQKSADSLVELGQAFMQSADDRYQKRYDSIGGFLDYWTFGIPSGLVQGYVDRADKAFNSPNDTANWLTFGIHGTIREATFPTNAWSSEHWANIFGVGGLMLGGGYASSMIKPHNLLTSKGGGARINSFSHPGTGNTGAYNPNFTGATGQGLGKLEGMEINVSQKGLDIVKTHISTFDSYAPNQAMIQRIESALQTGKPLTGADASFYMHEVSEFTKMGKGMGYDAAHASAIQKYEVSPFSVYHPDVIKSMPGEFNSSWFKFWGLEK
ncbi:WXG100 family type VII secretion target [Paenibacillus pabuli]|uniref:WXG100 family type VII secretion target n=1 Tax=Paenibacillus pabuli TaxID=1472 RepID=UPI00083B9F7F|nr:WXG100 family type VII secretion target [Paenibacillus pabuli]MEC0128992.1 WXG100 family type VII secretion target [Paenibacillus pabuli]